MSSRHLPRRQAAMRDAEDSRGRDLQRRRGAVGPGTHLPHPGLQPAAHGQGLLRRLRDHQEQEQEERERLK